MSTISAGTTSGSALVNSGDTTGNLVFQTNGTTTALTLNTSQNATFAGDVSVTGAISSTAGFSSPLAVKGNSTAGAEIRLPEDTDNGSNYVALKAADSIASNVTFTLPAADGTSGQVLQTNGSGTLSFATPAGGSWTYLSAVTASSSATVDIETTIDSTYDVYVIVGTAIKTDTDGSSLRSRVKVSGSYQSGNNYYYHQSRQQSNSGTYSGTASGPDSNFQLFSALGSTSSRSCNFYYYLFSPADTGVLHCVSYTGTMIDDGGIMRMLTGGGYYNSTTAVTGVQFYFSSGNVASGTFRLYGIKNS